MVDVDDLEDALISIETETGVTWSLRGDLAEKYSFRDDLVFEYGRKAQKGGNRTNVLYLMFGRVETQSKEERDRYYCCVKGCPRSYKAPQKT